jgi:hypothetical protein
MRSFLLAAMSLLLWTDIAAAADLEAVVLAPTEHAEAQLVVVSPDGTETRYTPADLETFPTYRLVTTTPWRDQPTAFEGVLLADVLAANGLSEVESIFVTAENDYSTRMTRKLLTTVDVLVATRLDGRAHTRRARGPIQFVIDAETYATSDVVSESDLVWMASRIEPGM